MFEASGVPQRVTQAAGLLAPVASAELWRLGDDELEASIDALLAARAAGDAAMAALLAEADSRGLRARIQAPTTQRWLTQRMRFSRGLADRLVREADLLAAEPVLREALAAGACTGEQAVVIGKTMAELPATVDEPTRTRAVGLLVEQCQALDPVGLAKAGRHLHEQLTTTPDTDDRDEMAKVEADAAEQAAQVERSRSLTWRRRADGSISGRFRLDPAGGQLFCAAITALAQHRDPTLGAGQVGGLDGAPLTPAETRVLVDPSTADTRTGPQRRADALVTLVQRAAKTGQLPDRGGTPTTLLVTTTLETLEGRLAGAGLLPYGGTLDPTALRMLACDAHVIPAVLAGDSHVLDLGRTRRLFTPAQRRAITLRDQGCIHPGCTAAPIDCDAHHGIPWWDGGPTDVDNGYLLCRYDHQRHHREGWTIHRDSHGDPYVVPPASIDPQRKPRQHLRYQTRRLRT